MGFEELLVLNSPATPKRSRLSRGDEILRTETVVQTKEKRNFGSVA